MTKTHKDLDVWQAGVAVAERTYTLTWTFPKEELFGLTAQMRRSAVPIASNIAEGAARRGAKEFAQYLYVAAGSASDRDTQLEIAGRIGLGKPEELERARMELSRVAMMLQGLIRSLRPRT